MSAADSHIPPFTPGPRRKRRRLLLFIFLLLLLIGAVLYPPTFLFAVRQLLGLQAWRYGFHLAVESMDGSVTDPIWLYHAHVTHDSAAGTSTNLEINKARIVLDWTHLVWRRDIAVWRDLSLDGLTARIDLPGSSEPPPPSASFFHSPSPGSLPRFLLPASLTVSDASIAFQQNGDFIRLDGVDLHTSDVEAGQVVIRALSLHQPWLTSVYSNCRGTLALQDAHLLLSRMVLTDSVSIASASADLPALLQGRLQMDFALDAFSGAIRGELKSGPREEHLIFDSDGTFSNISVSQLAAFLGQDADGSIKEGKFTFHGSPRDLGKATFSTRFDAADFRWGARRWTSLVLGATYVNRRLLIPEFELRQSHNSLTLKGDMSVPEDWARWWQTDFSFAVAARIDSLSELSALIGPAFHDIFGRLTIDGSVRGENSSFDGQLIASGSRLSFRSAPLDELQAAIRLHGNEVQVTNAEFTHGDDFLRAHGVVNILGEKKYWGEVKAAVADLSLYAAFLQPPLAPQAFGGGLMLDWSGDGAANAHSGAFHVTLDHIRPLGAKEAAHWHPFDLTASATYSPQSIYFSEVTMGNGATNLAGRVVATPRALAVDALKLQHGSQLWLSGSAQVPLNVWAAWQDPSTAAWWNFDGPCKLDLAADHLSLQDALLLSGRELPYQGQLTGQVHTEGTLATLSARGSLDISNASGIIPAGHYQAASASLALSGSQAFIKSSSGVWNSLAWSSTGVITARDVRSPLLDLAVQVPSAPVIFGSNMGGLMSFDVHASGNPGTLLLMGAAQLQKVDIGQNLTIANVVAPGGLGFAGGLPTFFLQGPPAWRLDLDVTGDAQARLGDLALLTPRPGSPGAAASSRAPASVQVGHLLPALHVAGTIDQPHLTGSIGVRDLVLKEGPDQLRIADGIVYLNPSNPAAPSFAFHADGNAAGRAYDGYMYGTLADKHFSWSPDITAVLSGHPDLAGDEAFTTDAFHLDATAPPYAAQPGLSGSAGLLLDAPPSLAPSGARPN